MPPKKRFITCEICGDRASRREGEKRMFMAKFPREEARNESQRSGFDYTRGNGIHTNFNARLAVDSLKLAVVKMHGWPNAYRWTIIFRAAMFQCLLGLECKDFTMIAADQTATKSVFIIKNDYDKLIPIADRLIMGVSGDPGDILQFSNYVSNNLALYQIRNNYPLDTAASVHFTRKSLTDSYKNGTPYLMNFLMGGWDEKEGGQLFVLDHLATSVRVPYAAHGFGGMFGVSILEYYHTRDMTEAQAYEVMQMCVKEIHLRLFLNLPNFQVKVVSKNGVSTLPMVYTPKMIASPGLDVPAAPGLK